MRAVIYAGAGGPEVITIGEVPNPEVKPGHIRVRMHAAGLNRADLHQRQGNYPAPKGWPANIPGLEYAGEVEAVRGPSRWKVGDRVMGLVGGGAQAEMVVVHQDEALPVPEGLSYAEAAAIPEAFLTAYDALVTRGAARARRACADPRGRAAASAPPRRRSLTTSAPPCSARRAARTSWRAPRYMGSITASTPARASFRDARRRAGARDPRCPRRPRFRRQPGGAGPAGPPGAARASLAGRTTDADLGPILRKRLEVIGTLMRPRGLEERIPLVREFIERMIPLFDQRIEHAAPLRPVVERMFPMAELADAHRLMESNETFGKVVVTW